MARILRRTFSTRTFASLTAPERRAVFEAIRISVISREAVSETDRCEVRRGLLALPWAGESSDPSPAASRPPAGRPVHVTDPATLLELAHSFAEALPRPEVRERLFRVMLALLFADGGSDRDLPLLDPIRSGLGISAARGDEILDELKDELVALVVDAVTARAVPRDEA